jgi:hypothetical protein
MEAVLMAMTRQSSLLCGETKNQLVEGRLKNWVSTPV